MTPSATGSVDPGRLAQPGTVTAPLPSKLQNHGDPEFRLRECDADEMPKKGTVYTDRNMGSCVQAGHIYFHPETRKPPIPSAASLRAFIADHPELPVIVEDDREVEYPHLVFADFVWDGVKVAIDENSVALIRLFTVCASHCGVAFDPATHFINGKQYEGVDILDWNTVNFDAHVGTSPRSAWLELYERLWMEYC